MRLRIHMTPMKISMIALVLMVLIVAVGDSNTVLAATGNEALTTKLDLGMGDDFNDMMRKITGGFLTIAKIVSVIMTATAGIMIAFNLGGPNKMVWNWLLGIGLALNFGGLLLNLPGFGLDSYSLQTATSGYENIPDAIYPKMSKDDDTSFNVFAVFMDYYLNNIILPGAKALTPIAARLLIVLTVIDCSVKLALDLVSGDKIKFLVTVLLKNGFYLWLILNWISGMNIVYRMQDGFQALGFLAGGQDIAGGVDKKFQPDSIVNNAYMSFDIIWNGNSDVAKDTGFIDSIKNKVGHFVAHTFSPITSFAMLVCLVISIGLLFLTALEMFIARIEFYTMGLLTIPLLAFGAVGQLNFLFRNAVGALFNLAIKVCVISFIQVFSTVMLARYVQKLCDSVEKNVYPGFGNFPIMFQLILVCLILYFMTKNIPNLVNSLLSGSPSLSGGSMASSLKQGMKTGAKAAGATAAVLATGGAAIAAGGIKGGLGTAAKMAMSGMKNTVANSAPVKGFTDMTNTLLGNQSETGQQGLLNGGSSFAMSGNGRGASAFGAIKKFSHGEMLSDDKGGDGKDGDGKGKGSGGSGGSGGGGGSTGGDGPSRVSNGSGGGFSGGGGSAAGSKGASESSGGGGNVSTSESHSSSVSGNDGSYQPRKARDSKQSQDQDKEGSGGAKASEQKSKPVATQPANSDRYQDGYADGKKESSNKMSDANGAYVPHHTPTTSQHTSVSTTTSEHASAESVLTKKHEE